MEYFDRLKHGDFLPCYIDYEGTGLGPAEAVVSGMTPIVMNKPWNESRFPDGYKLSCHNEKEFERLMFFCADKPAAAKRIGAEAVKFSRKIFGKEAIGRQWSTVLDFYMQSRNKETVERAGRHFMFALVEKAVAQLPESFSRDEFLEKLASVSKKRKPKELKQLWPQLRAIALALGVTEGKGMLQVRR